MNRLTIFSPDRLHRYTLWREFGGELDLCFTDGKNDGERGRDNYVQFIGLNPSTADELVNDNTVTRCINYSKAWGFGAYCMTNLYAWRETDSDKLFDAPDPIGPDNDKHLIEIARGAGLIVACWGTKARPIQEAWAKENIPNLHYLRLTKHGHPEHPLYLPKNLTPKPWLTNTSQSLTNPTMKPKVK